MDLKAYEHLIRSESAARKYMDPYRGHTEQPIGVTPTHLTILWEPYRGSFIATGPKAECRYPPAALAERHEENPIVKGLGLYIYGYSPFFFEGIRGSPSCFRRFVSIFLTLSTTGNSSGMVPPNSRMVSLTFAPTSL